MLHFITAQSVASWCSSHNLSHVVTTADSHNQEFAHLTISRLNSTQHS